MKTFNNNPELKEGLLKELKAHQLADMFVQGSWLQEETENGFKGCFYGCTMQTKEEPLVAFYEMYHVDLWYVYLTENIFEGLPKGEFEKFPYEAIEVLPVGFDFNKAKSTFFTKLLTDQLQFCEGNEKVTSAVNQCIELFNVPFDQIDESAAWAAADAASLAAVASSAASEWAAAEAAWAAQAAAQAASSAAASSVAEAASSAAGEAGAAEKPNYYVKIKEFLFEAIKESA